MRHVLVSLFLGLVCCLFGGTPAKAVVIANGDFSSGLTHWTATGPVSDGGDFAVMEEDFASFLATLEQPFVVPVLAESLSFDYSLSSVPDNTSGYPFPDAFTASLLDSAGNPILNTPGMTDYFYHDAGGVIDYDPSIVNVTGNTTTLDVSSIAAGTNARIVFDLLLGDDGRTTRVEVDNVEVGVSSGVGKIPEPMSIAVWTTIFGVFGVGLSLIRRQRREV